MYKLHKWFWCAIILHFGVIPATHALDNGLALTPPMGWLSWLAFGCEVDCKTHPTTCISEKLVTDMADRMVVDGYRDAGYEYVTIDDCWLAGTRDASGNLQPDPARFSHGIKWLADYVHSKNLKMGIYEDYGTKTCAGYPGSIGHVEQDAQTFASWGIDYLKLDGCNVDYKGINEGYPAFRHALNRTGRPILYSCEWPLYTQMYEHKMPNYTAIRENCNVWRNYDDIGISWSQLLKTIDYFDVNQEELIKATGKGGWNDPDMLMVGNPGVPIDQARVQMALWSIWSVALIMSTDLRNMAPGTREILLNRKIIAINQDPLGVMGRLVVKTPKISVYLKPVVPVDKNSGMTSYAICFFNRNAPQKANVTVGQLRRLGLQNPKGYDIEDLYSGQLVGRFQPTDSFVTQVNATGVMYYKATIVV